MDKDETPRFGLAGMRYSRYWYDETVIFEKSKNGVVKGRFDISVSDPAVSVHNYFGRPVVELIASVKQVILPNDEDMTETEAISKDGVDCLEVVCVAGFVAEHIIHDGNMEAFLENLSLYSRSVYWMVRQRVKTLTASTMLNSDDLPWDLIRPETPVKAITAE
jgi:hypothetical protein